MEATSVTDQVTVLDINPSSPSAILTGEETCFRGSTRLFTQKVPVPDQILFQRPLSEVQKGDKIEVTVITEWHEDYSVTYLSTDTPASTSLPYKERIPAK
jgi:hypothetical protein